MKEQEVLVRIKEQLERILRDIPCLQIRQCILQAPLASIQVDLLVEPKVKHSLPKLLVEVKCLGEPRVIP